MGGSTPTTWCLLDGEVVVEGRSPSLSIPPEVRSPAMYPGYLGVTILLESEGFPPLQFEAVAPSFQLKKCCFVYKPKQWLHPSRLKGCFFSLGAEAVAPSFRAEVVLFHIGVEAVALSFRD